ncbi:MAG: CopG family transcriptional regulator [Acidobacteria bacterium]|nr:CopG family transcriptional regulator [Acidobacteriota bacterium]
MRRTQLYLEEDVWQVLHILARQSGSSVSDLVRKAVRDKYLSRGEGRRQALHSIVGIWKDRTDLPDTENYVRSLRKDDARFKRILR